MSDSKRIYQFLLELGDNLRSYRKNLLDDLRVAAGELQAVLHRGQHPVREDRHSRPLHVVRKHVLPSVHEGEGLRHAQKVERPTGAG